MLLPDVPRVQSQQLSSPVTGGNHADGVMLSWPHISGSRHDEPITVQRRVLPAATAADQRAAVQVRAVQHDAELGSKTGQDVVSDVADVGCVAKRARLVIGDGMYSQQKSVNGKKISK